MEESKLVKWQKYIEKGNRRLGQGDYQNAERFFRQSLKVAKEIAIPVVMAFSVRLLATSQVKQGLAESAALRFREALQICREINNYKGMAEAMSGMANVSILLNDLKEAVVWFKRAIAVYPKESSQLRLAMLFNDLGRVYAGLGQWQDAKITYEMAMQICRSFGFLKGLAELGVLSAEVCFRLGEKNEARQFLVNSCRIFVQSREREALISALLFLGSLDFEQENYVEASESVHRALVLQLQSAIGEEISESSYFLGKTLQGSGLYDEAFSYLSLSLKHYKRKDLGLALRLKSLAELMFKKKELIKAKGYIKEAVLILKHSQDPSQLKECQELLECIIIAQGESESAEGYAKQSRKMEGQHAVSFSAVHRLANYYEQRQNYVDAIQCYWQSMQIAREFGYETKALEEAVQRVSRKVRKKKR